jgi:glycosyltransferase involved in cell wall biosynthesis
VLSFIIPAHNEEALIGETLRILRTSANAQGEPYEIIVVDDASTDRTAEIARAAGATVVQIDRRQIAASRNAGARAARGDIFIFVDADTHVFPPTIRAAVAAIRDGAVGGGASIRLDAHTPLWARLTFVLLVWLMQVIHWAAGCFIFARRDAFEAVGGFDERYYATEELVLSRALKTRGRMVIVREPVLTSGRKARLYAFADLPKLLLGWALRGRIFLQRRENLHMWYDGRREKKRPSGEAPRSLP